MRFGFKRKNSTRRKSGRQAPRRVKRELLKIDGRNVEVVLRTNPRARRFIVKVDPSTGEVSVVAPSSRDLSSALAFARTEKDWIAGRLADIPRPVTLELGGPILYRGVEHVIRLGAHGGEDRAHGPVWVDRAANFPTLRINGKPEHAMRRLRDWLKKEARRRVEDAVAYYAAELGVKPRSITIRDTTSRWGSCSSTRRLSFSWRLILAPAFVLDYVVAHEVAHLREMNHEPRFWRLVDTLVPYVEKAQTWLAESGPVLHAYAPRERVVQQA
jgi:hypothetical protein